MTDLAAIQQRATAMRAYLDGNGPPEDDVEFLRHSREDVPFLLRLVDEQAEALREIAHRGNAPENAHANWIVARDAVNALARAAVADGPRQSHPSAPAYPPGYVAPDTSIGGDTRAEGT